MAAYKRISPQPVVEGGTGSQSFTTHGVLIGEGTSAITALSVANSGTVLIGNTGADPSFSASPTVDSITILNAPVAGTDGANKTYVDSVASGFIFITAVAAATTTNLTATYANGAAGVGATLTNSGTQAAFAVDGYSASLNDRILVKDQTSTLQNGIYTVTTVGTGATNWVLTRATDYDQPAEIKPGDLVPVVNGTANANSIWLQNATVTAVGTDPIIFVKFAGGIQSLVGNSGSATGANVMVSGGNNISSSGSGSTLTVNVSGTTNHAIQFGNASGSLTSAATGTSGQLFQSAGASSDPAWTTSTYPSTNVQGDLIYGSGANALSTLAKDTNSTRYLSNTGTSNNPAWAQVALTTGVTGVLPIANGGTNASSMATTDGTVIYDGTRLVTTATGTAGQVLTSNGVGVAPTYQAVSASGAVTSVNAGNSISITGTATAPIVNVAGTINHAVQIGNSSNSLSNLAVGATGQVLTGTTGADPAFAALGTNSGLTAHGVVIGEGNSALSATSAGTANQLLKSSGAAADPTWTTTTYPATSAQGDLIYGSALNALSTLAKDTNSTRYLSNTGTSNNPAWAQVALTTGVTGVLSIANGGTNASSMATTDGTVIYDGSRLVTTATGTAGQVLTSNGAGVAPTYQAVSASGAVTSVSGGNNITITGTATAPIVNVSGTTNHAVQIGNSTNSLTSIGTGTSGQLLQSKGSLADPAYTTSTYPSTNAQGDLIYGSAANALSTLAKSTTATRYLANTGTSNNPNWDQINLTNGVTGTLPVTNGGTGATLLTGVLIGNGASPVTGNTLTQFTTLVGGASNAINGVGPGTAGQLLISAGALANPAYITPTAGSGLTLTSNATTLSYALTTPVSIANGGTNTTTLGTTDGTVYFDGSKLATTTAGTAGQLLTSNGPGVAPTYQTFTPTGVVTSVNAGTNISITGTSSDPIVNFSGTLPIASGGTNATSFATTDGTVYFDGTRLVTTATGTANQVLMSNGAGVAPSYQNISATGAVTSVTAGNSITVTGTATAPIVNVGGTVNHALQVGNSTNSLSSLASGSTGQLLQSKGALLDPDFTTSTYPSTNAQGDLIYGSALNTLSTLAKNTTATRYLANTGTSNNPNWDQINLANGVTGTLPIANGGTNTTSFATTDGTVYYDGSKLTTTATGTSGQVLTSNGAGIAPTYQTVTPGTLGSWILIQTQDISAVSSVSFTSIGSYKTYILVFDNAIGSGTSTSMFLRYSTDNGSTFIATNYTGSGAASISFAAGGSFAGSATSSTSIPINTAAAGGSAFSGTLWLYNMNSSGKSPVLKGEGSTAVNPGPLYVVGGYNTTTTACNAFEVIVTSGTFSGKFSLYGLVQ